MAKKIVKRKKIRIFRLLLLLLIIGTIVFFAYSYIKTNTRNIIIKGNTYLNDEEILQISNLTNYPSFLTLLPSRIEKKLEQNKYIKKATVKRKFYHTITIKIEEYKILFFNNNNHKYVLDDKSEIESDKNIRVPTLLNYTPEDKYQKFIEDMKNVDKSILGKISEISYNPNDYDKDRFLLYQHRVDAYRNNGAGLCRRG